MSAYKESLRKILGKSSVMLIDTYEFSNRVATQQKNANSAKSVVHSSSWKYLNINSL